MISRVLFSRAVRIRVVFVLWLAIAMFYVFMASRYVGMMMADDTFEEYLVNVVDLVGTQRRPTEELHELVLLRARDLDLPVGPTDIQVDREGRDIDLVVQYSIKIDVPLVLPGGYHKQFTHEVRYSPPR